MESSSEEHPCSRREIERIYSKDIIKEEDLKRLEILDFIIEYKRNGEVRSTKFFRFLANNSSLILYLMEILNGLNCDKAYEVSDELKQKLEDVIIELLKLKTTIVNDIQSSIYDNNKYTPLGYAFKNHMSKILDALLKNNNVDVNKRCQIPYNPFPMDKTYYHPLLISLGVISLDSESILNGDFIKILKHPKIKLEYFEIEYIIKSFMNDPLKINFETEEVIRRIEILDYIKQNCQNSIELENKINNVIENLYEKLNKKTINDPILTRKLIEVR